MRDVAAAAGVHPSVVSKLLNGDSRLSVRPETRERVLDAVERLGYTPNTAARTLKTARTMAIGMVIPNLANAAYAEIARGAEERARSAGFILLIASGRLSDRLDVLEGRTDGLLYAIATSDEPLSTPLAAKIPTLLINRREQGFGPSVIVDDEAAARLATEHLIELGHRRIAHVSGPLSADTARRRLAGYTAAMDASGNGVPAGHVVEARFDESHGFEATTTLLELDPVPTAIFVANTRAAIGAMAACGSAGLSIPGDISVVGFDDVAPARFLRPPLTTVRRPLALMGAKAIDQLIVQMEGKPIEDLVVDEPSVLVPRASSAPPNSAW